MLKRRELYRVSLLGHIRDAAVRAGALPEETTVDWLRALQAGYQARAEAAVRYVPRRYAGRVILLRTAKSDPVDDAATAGPIRPEAEDYGWGGMCAETIVVHRVAGTHESLVREPDVAQVAGRLAAYLQSSP